MVHLLAELISMAQVLSLNGSEQDHHGGRRVKLTPDVLLSCTLGIIESSVIGSLAKMGEVTIYDVELVAVLTCNHNLLVLLGSGFEDQDGIHLVRRRLGQSDKPSLAFLPDRQRLPLRVGQQVGPGYLLLDGRQLERAGRPREEVDIQLAWLGRAAPILLGIEHRIAPAVLPLGIGRA